MSTSIQSGPRRRGQLLLLMACMAAVLALPTTGCRTVQEGPAAQPEIDSPPDASAEETPAAEPEVVAEPEPPPLPLWTDDPYADFPDYRGKRTFAVGSGRSIFGRDASFRKALKDARGKLADALTPYFSEPSAAADAAQMHAMHRAQDGALYVLIGIPNQTGDVTPEPAPTTDQASPEEKPKEEAPMAEPEDLAEPEPPRPLWTDDPYAEFPDYRGKRTFAVGSGRSIFGGNASFRKAQKDARRKLAHALTPYVSDPSAAADAAQMHAMHKTQDGTVYVLIGMPDQTGDVTPEPAPTAAQVSPEEKPKPEHTSGRPGDTKAITAPPPEPDRPAPQVAEPTAKGADTVPVDRRFITTAGESEPAPPPLAIEPEPVAATEEVHPSAASTYFSDRGYDFLDMLGVRVGGGSTVYLRARPTKFAMLGAGFFRGKWFGLHGRAAGRWREKRHEGGALVLYEVQYERSAPCGNAFMCDETFLPTSSERPRRRGWLPIDKSVWELADDDHHWADLGLGAGLLAVAADAHVSPFQMADFLLGILGIDIADDDARNRAPCAQSQATDPEELASR